jgi:hypothetical protein
VQVLLRAGASTRTFFRSNRHLAEFAVFVSVPTAIDFPIGVLWCRNRFGTSFYCTERRETAQPHLRTALPLLEEDRMDRLTNHVGRAIAAAALALCAGTAFAQSYPDVPVTTDATTQSMENFNYGVCHGTDPSCYHNWGVARQKKVLLFTRTAGPRHASLGTALASGLNPPLVSCPAN